MHDYATPESVYDLGPGASHELLAELSRALLSGATLRHGAVTATATSVKDASFGPQLVNCDAFGSSRVFLHLVGRRRAREALESARNKE